MVPNQSSSTVLVLSQASLQPPQSGLRSHDFVTMRVLALVVRAPLGAVAAAAAAAFAAGGDRYSAAAAAAVALGTMLTSAVLLRSWQRRASHLPVLRFAYPTVVSCFAAAACIALAPALQVRGLGVGDWILVLLVGAAGSTLTELARARMRRARAIRVAFIGSGEAAQRLSHDLARSRFSAYELVGMIGVSGEPDPRVPVVGALGELRAVVLRERIDLLVMGSSVARLTVFDELASSCLDLRLQITELSEFYEDVFGQVPTAEINAAWFAHLVDAHAPAPSATGKRAFDVLASVVLGVLTFPLVLVLALLVRLDGGPAIFAQERIGEGGRPFRLYKLRTMRVGSGDVAAWAREGDLRTTAIGRILRRTHRRRVAPALQRAPRRDEHRSAPARAARVCRAPRTPAALLPAPPPHPAWADGLGPGPLRLRTPSATPAWKLCNDLYYVKHRSMGLDLLLLAETAGRLLTWSTNRTAETFLSWAGTGIAPEAAVAELPPAVLLPVASAGEVAVLRPTASRED